MYEFQYFSIDENCWIMLASGDAIADLMHNRFSPASYDLETGTHFRYVHVLDDFRR